MNDVRRLVIKQACADLCSAYARTIDAYDYDGFLKLWSDDAVLDMLGREYRGHAGIRSYLEAREANMICRHLVTNVEIEVEDENTAQGTCYTISFVARNGLGKEPGPVGQPTFVVDYENFFLRDPARGWVFSRRKVRAAMAGEEQLAMLRGDAWPAGAKNG